MIVDRQTLLFFDASSLFVAARTTDGGSGYLLKICQHGFMRACASPAVLQETERSLLAKAPRDTILTHRLQIADAGVMVVSVPSPSFVARFNTLFREDDHVVASAVDAGADFLITLDRRLIARTQGVSAPFVAVTPGDFLADIFPDHQDHDLIRRTVS